MGRISFEAYGAQAGTAMSETEQAGRYTGQAKAERLIGPDLVAKMDLSKTDTLLDIGCGPGLIARMLAPRVKRVVVLDHPNIIRHLRPKVRGRNISLIAGDFMSTNFKRQFEKVIIYSVLHYLSTPEDALAFVDKACSLLKPGGRLLIGELANRDLKDRFANSAAGKRFDKTWQKTKGRVMKPIDDPEHFPINDAFVLDLQRHLRAQGLHAWLLPENPALPFGNTREDLLVARP
jgi:2-polyprenyl-3-methyl-5-hydroxy-6-metoxy-1,4-benzoquinol methylase